MLFKFSPLQIEVLQKECEWLILKNLYINQLNQHIKAGSVFYNGLIGLCKTYRKVTLLPDVQS